MASTLRIVSRALPRASSTLFRTAAPSQALNDQLGRRQLSRTAARFEIIKRFTEDHEWITLDTKTNIGTVGITEYAAKALGDVVYVELPAVGDGVSMGDSVGSVESVKSASDIMSPVSGVIVDVNSSLDEKPKLINEEPEGEKGWIVKIEATEEIQAQLNELMDVEAYKKHTTE